MRWSEIVNQAMKDYTDSTGKVIDEYDLNDLNDYLKIVFDAYEFYGFYSEDLENISDSNLDFFFSQNDEALYNVVDDDYEAVFPNKNLNFALGLIILHIFRSFSIAYNFTKDDLPTVRACLDTPYAKRKEAEEKIKLYFWSKERHERPFFMQFFDFTYGLWGKPGESLVICRYDYEEKNIKLKNNLKKLFDIVTNAKLVKKAIPYGRIYEVFSQDDKWLFTVINEIGNNRDESEDRIYDCHILTNDVELREFLESFLDVQVGVRVTEFDGCEKYIYGNMKNGSKMNEHEKLLSINSEVFAGIKVVGKLNMYGWWED